MGTTITGLLRNVFIFIDSIVYGLIGKVYELLIDIANTSIISGDTIDKFADRVYALLAVFMLFKLSFSILTYIINPDSSTDKSTGTGKLIGNILITIVLLISVPWCFDQVWKIQTSILSDNIIGKIILGTNGADDDSIATQFNAGDEMAWTTFSAFFYPDVDGCSNPDSNDCNSALKAIEFEVGETKTNVASAYSRIKKSQLVSGIKNSGLVNSQTADKKFVFEYMPLISTIAGGFIVYILILFCIQIAVRSVKLGVLQLIAPIPVISYLDPKQGKDGMFKKWLKICGKTFADLFIRLAAIYFAVFIISEITSGSMTDVITGQEQTSVLVKVLVIIGALTFAKELPKFIEEITGIKLDGGFSMNPFKNNALLGGIAGGFIGAGIGAVGGFAGNLIAGNGVGNAFRGFGKGLVSGGVGGAKDKGIKKDTWLRGAKAGVTTGTNYANWDAAGSKMGGRLSDRMRSSIGARTKAQELDDKIKVFDDMAKFRDDLKNQANYDTTAGDARKLKGLDDTLSSYAEIKNKYASGGTKALKQYYDDLVASNADTKDITNARVAWEEAQKNSITNATTVELQAMKADMERYVSENSSILGDKKYEVGSSSSYDKINEAYAQAKQDSIRTKSSEEYRAAKANERANKEAKASK